MIGWICHIVSLRFVMNPDCFYCYLPSPVGDFLIAGTDETLAFTGFTSGYQQRTPDSDWIQDASPLTYAVEPLQAYFDGESVDFKIPLGPVGTPFQQQVWTALQAIPHGSTCSYGDIAIAIGRPGASRAVGAANHANHLPIVIPCHRVIGADGSLTGFGGGLETKAVLLRLEGCVLPDRDRQLDLY